MAFLGCQPWSHSCFWLIIQYEGVIFSREKWLNFLFYHCQLIIITHNILKDYKYQKNSLTLEKDIHFHPMIIQTSQCYFLSTLKWKLILISNLLIFVTASLWLMGTNISYRQAVLQSYHSYLLGLPQHTMLTQSSMLLSHQT